MFDNIASLKFVKGQNSEMIAMAMVSSEGETMEYQSPVTADGRVEEWMTNVLNEMRRTNRLITKEAVFYYCSGDFTRYADVGAFPDKASNMTIYQTDD